MFTKAACRITM